MKEITAETTLGSLAASFADMVIERSSKEYVKHASITDNIIRGELFNFNEGMSVRIVYKAKINGEIFEASDSCSPHLGNSDGDILQLTQRDTGVEFYITKKVMIELTGKIREQLLKTLNKEL